MLNFMLDGVHTLIHQLQFGDNVQSNIRKFVFQHLQEHGKKMRNCPGGYLLDWNSIESK